MLNKLAGKNDPQRMALLYVDLPQLCWWMSHADTVKKKKVYSKRTVKQNCPGQNIGRMLKKDWI